MEMIEDRPLDQLFGFIIDRSWSTSVPRGRDRAAQRQWEVVHDVEVRRADSSDTSELAISSTLLTEVVEERKALAFMDVRWTSG